MWTKLHTNLKHNPKISKRIRMLKLFTLLLASSLANCQTWNANTVFANTAVLDTDVNLQWNFTDTDIHFRLAIRTSGGWLGFGLSPNGGMANSDVMLTWVGPDGGVQFIDAHTANRNVWPDTVQNWKSLFFGSANGLTTAIFTRKIKVSEDRRHDWIFSPTTNALFHGYTVRKISVLDACICVLQ